MDELTDVLLLKITKKLNRYTLKELSILKKNLRFVCNYYLWKIISKEKIPMTILKKYGGLVRIIKERSYSNLKFDYNTIYLYCKNIRLIKLEHYELLYFNHEEPNEYFDGKHIRGNHFLSNANKKMKISYIRSQYMNHLWELSLSKLKFQKVSISNSSNYICGLNTDCLEIEVHSSYTLSDLCSLYKTYPFKQLEISAKETNLDYEQFKLSDLSNLECIDFKSSKTGIIKNWFDYSRIIKKLTFNEVNRELITLVYQNYPNLKELKYNNIYINPDIIKNPSRLEILDVSSPGAGKIYKDLHPKVHSLVLRKTETFRINQHQFPNLRTLSVTYNDKFKYWYQNSNIQTLKIKANIRQLASIDYSKFIGCFIGLKILCLVLFNYPSYLRILNDRFNNIKLTLPQDFSVENYLVENSKIISDNFNFEDIVEFFKCSLKFAYIKFYIE